MFCINCGANVPDGSKFCPKCGAKIECDENPTQKEKEPDHVQQDESAEPTRKIETAGSTQTTQQVQEDEFTPDNTENMPDNSDGQKGKRISGKVIGIIVAAVVVVAAVVIVLIFAVGGGSAITIDLNQYVEIAFSGYNGEGTAVYNIKKGSLASEYAGKISLNENNSNAVLVELGSSDPVYALADALYEKGSVSPSSGLSNGDTVTFKWDADMEDIEKSFNVKLKYSDFEKEVKGLEESEAVSPDSTQPAGSEENGDGTENSEEDAPESPQPSEKSDAGTKNEDANQDQTGSEDAGEDNNTPVNTDTSNIMGSGTCGDNLTWTLDNGGTLAISGSGEIFVAMSSNELPWYSDYDLITTVVIGKDVSSLDYQAILSWPANALREIQVEDGNPSYCSTDGVLFSADRTTLLSYPKAKTLETYNIPEGTTSISTSAFSNCENLTSVIFPSTLSELDSGVFSYCANLKQFTFTGNAPLFGYVYNGTTYIMPAFQDIVATIYYPGNNPTWTADVLQDYGGTITWEPY